MRGGKGARHPMNPPPSSAHDSSLWSEALDRAERLHTLTTEILHQGEPPDLPLLGQLIMQRDKLLTELEALPLSRLPEERRELLLEKLRLCQEMDARVAGRMQAFQSGLSEKLQGMKAGQALTEKYRLPADDPFS